MNASAMALRATSLAIIILRRSKRSKTTPEMGPATMAGTMRAIMTPPTARPEPVRCRARLNTATLLKWSPTSLTTWPIQVYR